MVAVVTACGGGSGLEAPSGTATDRTGTTVEFDPANFVDPTLDSNPYHPLRPGLQWVRRGVAGGRTGEVITTMTDVIRLIDGAPAIVMMNEQTTGTRSRIGIDYLALDQAGNVWIMGGYTVLYQDGGYIETERAWLGATDVSAIGILSPPTVTADTPRWFIAAGPDAVVSVGEPVAVGGSECVAAGCYDEVRVVREGALDGVAGDDKYYAPGVGLIKSVPQDPGRRTETIELLDFRELIPEKLDERSRFVLGLEQRAAARDPDVFGSTPESIRAR